MIQDQINTNYQQMSKEPFSLKGLLDSSCKLLQFGHYDSDIVNYENCEMTLRSLDELKLSVREMKLSDAYMHIARNTHKNALSGTSVFVITLDNYVVSDNTIFVANIISRTDSPSKKKLYACIQIQKTVADLVSQSCSTTSQNIAQPVVIADNMSDIQMPSVTQSAEMPKADGSGDMIGTNAGITSAIEDEDDTFLEMLRNAGNYLRGKKITSEKIIEEFKLLELGFKASTAEVNESQRKCDLHFDHRNVALLDDSITFDDYVSLPTVRKAAKIADEFSCSTMEGITIGKAGDMLVIGVDGEIYPCDYDVFCKTYAKLQMPKYKK